MRKVENKQKLLRRFVIAALAIASFVFMTACADSASDIADMKGGVTAQQIIENPSAYVGKTVTVSGDVEEIHGPRAFNMDSGTSVGELLIVGREPFPQLPDAGDRAYVINDVATVTGTLRNFVAADIEKEIGWDLTPDLETKFNGKPVLVVQKVAFKSGKGGAVTTTGNDVNKASNDTAMTDKDKMAGDDTLTDITVFAKTQDKASLVGKNANFEKLKVARIVGPRTFTVAAEGSQELYVMLDEASAKGVGTQGKIDVGTMVNISGEFEKLTAEEVMDVANNRFRGMTQTEREFMKDKTYYFQADKVTLIK